jgi:Ferritin-like domain
MRCVPADARRVNGAHCHRNTVVAICRKATGTVAGPARTSKFALTAVACRDLRHDQAARRARSQDRWNDPSLDRLYRAAAARSRQREEYVAPADMLSELRDDNNQLTASMREVHDLCEQHHDVASSGLLENWIDETERRVWFLSETTRPGTAG